MSNANPVIGSAEQAPEQSLRVTDVGRSLWLLTGLVLVLGYAALHALSGAGDAPQLEKVAPSAPAAASSASDESAELPVHTLHPMTSSDLLPAVPPHDLTGLEEPVGQRSFVERQSWLEFPAKPDASGQPPVQR